jgi:hypothetical protein
MADIGADMELLGALDPVGNHGRTLIAQGKQAMEWSKELERS